MILAVLLVLLMALLGAACAIIASIACCVYALRWRLEGGAAKPREKRGGSDYLPESFS